MGKQTFFLTSDQVLSPLSRSSGSFHPVFGSSHPSAQDSAGHPKGLTAACWGSLCVAGHPKGRTAALWGSLCVTLSFIVTCPETLSTLVCPAFSFCSPTGESIKLHVGPFLQLSPGTCLPLLLLVSQESLSLAA